MANEFRTLQATCSSLIPQGPGYENVTLDNQVCTAVGSLPGHPFVDGDRFLQLAYGFSWSDGWKVSIYVVFRCWKQELMLPFHRTLLSSPPLVSDSSSRFLFSLNP